MWMYIKNRSKIFYNEILSSVGILISLAIFIAIKIYTNLSYGASFTTAIRSGILGSIFYIVGYFSIALFAVKNEKIPKKNLEIQSNNKNKVLLIVLFYSLFLLLRNIDFVQRAGYISGNPVLSYIPGYNLLLSFVNSSIAEPIASLSDVIKPEQINHIITGILFAVIIPFFIFRKLGYTFKGRVFSMKNSRAVWPIIFIYIIMVITKGLKVEAIWFIAYAFLNPALQEEFFSRGIILPVFAKFFKNTGNIIVVGTIIFTLLHFPDFYFRVHEQDFIMTISKMSAVMITGILYAYGYRKTGTLMPMMIVHALEDALFLF